MTISLVNTFPLISHYTNVQFTYKMYNKKYNTKLINL